jgi:hypothetical protein
MYEFYSYNSICFFLLIDHFIFNFIFTSKSLMEKENPPKKSQKRKRNEKDNEKSQKLFIIQPTNLDRWRSYHYLNNNVVLKMKNEGSSMCENYCENGFCVLEDTLGETIKDIGKKPCNAKGNCGKNKVCVYACHRFDCYAEAAKLLGYTKQCPLPICIRLEIEFYYGKSIKGF